MSELCKCGRPHDGWPGKDGQPVCQMCWEAQCSESWWRMVAVLDRARKYIFANPPKSSE